jgi:ureidoacrylate peracid hydrolase
MSSFPAKAVRDDDLLLTLEQKVDPGHTALLVIDVQNDFCASGGFYDRTGSDTIRIQAMIPRLQQLLIEAREAQVPVIFVAAGYGEAYLSSTDRERYLRLYGQVMPVCRPGTWGAEFYEVAPRHGEPVIVKRRYSAFHGTDLEVLLRNLGIRTLVVLGVATNVCVEAAARDAFMRDYYVVVVSDCTAARDENFHRSALANIEAHFASVVAAEAIVGAWKAR